MVSVINLCTVKTLITDDNINFINNKETIFLASGFEISEKMESFPFLEAANELLSNPDFDGNIIEIDWTGGASALRNGLLNLRRLTFSTGTLADLLEPTGYSQAAANTRGAGRTLAYFIKKIVQDRGVSPSKINLVGHSLGGQMSGFAGKSWNVIKLWGSKFFDSKYFNNYNFACNIEPYNRIT